VSPVEVVDALAERLKRLNPKLNAYVTLDLENARKDAEMKHKMRKEHPDGESLRHPGAVWAVAFSPNGETLVTGCRDGSARLWDTGTGTPVGPSWHHQAVVWAVACSPDGQTVVTGSGDQTARLWQIPRPVADEPERITLWTQVITGMELDGHGVVRWLDAAAWRQCRQRLEVLGGPPVP
jgi:eukaryotic-like serine/threonine-protein kinase